MIVTRYHCWKLGVAIAESFRNQLADLKEIINEFRQENQKPLTLDELYNKANLLNTITDLVYSYLKISNVIDKMSSYQKNMIIDLHRLKMSIDDSKLLKIIENSIKELESSKKKKAIEIKSRRLDKNIKKVETNIEHILTNIDGFLLKGNILTKGLNFLFNDTFGSLKQLKCELMSRFNAESFKVDIKKSKKISIDCLLVRSSSSSSNKLESNSSNSSSNSSLSVVSKPETVMIICNRSTAPYELNAYYDKWLECYLGYGLNVVLWNYRGYGESTGLATSNNVQTDAEEIVEYIKKEYGFINIGVHGIGFGGIPAGYLVKRGIVNFCFADRSFSNLYDFVDTKTFNKCSLLLNMFFIKNVDIAELILANNKMETTVTFNGNNENNTSDNIILKNNVYKVISYDLSKEFIHDKVSLKSGIANEFYNTLNQIEHKKSFMETILSDTDREYEIFENDLTYLINKIKCSKDEDEKLDLCALQNNFISTNSSFRYNHLENELTSSSRLEQQKETNNISMNTTTTNANTSYSESKVVNMIKILFEKFDAGGETLLDLDMKNKKLYINNFFINMLTWGSFKIGQVYATDKLIAFRAISKKFSYLNLKISKIISNPSKYSISDPLFSSSLKSLLKALFKIEKFFNQLLFESISDNNEDSQIHNRTMNRSSIIESGDLSTSLNGTSLNQSEINSSSNSYRNIQISDFIKEANLGNLLILSCGHEGLFNSKELEMYSIYLLNSNFLK